MAKCKVCGAIEADAEFYSSIKTHCKEHWKARMQHSLNGLAGKSMCVCPKCGGQMKPGKAIAQTFTGTPEWEGDTLVTMSPGGPGKLIDCLKCEKCGHSVSAGKGPR